MPTLIAADVLGFGVFLVVLPFVGGAVEVWVEPASEAGGKETSWGDPRAFWEVENPGQAYFKRFFAPVFDSRGAARRVARRSIAAAVPGHGNLGLDLSGPATWEGRSSLDRRHAVGCRP